MTLDWPTDDEICVMHDELDQAVTGVLKTFTLRSGCGRFQCGTEVAMAMIDRVRLTVKAVRA